MRGYESGDDSSGHPQSKGAAENSQENAKGLEHGHDFEGVAVVALRLVGNYRPEIHIKNIHCNAGISIQDTTQSKSLLYA